MQELLRLYRLALRALHDEVLFAEQLTLRVLSERDAARVIAAAAARPTMPGEK